jgi:hypothetical protein
VTTVYILDREELKAARIVVMALNQLPRGTGWLYTTEYERAASTLLDLIRDTEALND